MTSLYTALQGPGVKDGKVSKVLHLKRPGLYPILDSALSAFYAHAARDAARDYPEDGFRRMYWAAIRKDVLTNQDALRQLRPTLANNETLRTYRVNQLSDLRLLDILAWKAQTG